MGVDTVFATVGNDTVDVSLDVDNDDESVVFAMSVAQFESAGMRGGTVPAALARGHAPTGGVRSDATGGGGPPTGVALCPSTDDGTL